MNIELPLGLVWSTLTTNLNSLLLSLCLLSSPVCSFPVSCLNLCLPKCCLVNLAICVFVCLSLTKGFALSFIEQQIQHSYWVGDKRYFKEIFDRVLQRIETLLTTTDPTTQIITKQMLCQHQAISNCCFSIYGRYLFYKVAYNQFSLLGIYHHNTHVLL